jgi:hypothetical protein
MALFSSYSLITTYIDIPENALNNLGVNVSCRMVGVIKKGTHDMNNMDVFVLEMVVYLEIKRQTISTNSAPIGGQSLHDNNNAIKAV